MPKTTIYIIDDNPYFGKQKYRVARMTRTQMITNPINSVGAVLRFRRPKGIGLVDGEHVTPTCKAERDRPGRYTIHIERED